MVSTSAGFLLLGILAALLIGGWAGAGVARLRSNRPDAKRREEQKMVAIGTAAARILHQIKNPLQTIVLHVDLLQSPAVEDPSARAEVSEAIAAEAQRLMAMLNELSVYAAGASRALQLQPVPLHELLQELARREAREAGLAVDTHRIDECVVLADPYYLRQAFENLVVNARDAMRDRPDGRLTLRMERRGDTAVVGVIDTGPGIPPERQESIFQPFVSGKIKGMGLGLAISREIVEGHGGRIEVRSTPGAGAHFSVHLPLHAST